MPLKGDIKTALQNLAAAKRTRIVNAFASGYGYPATIPDPNNPAGPQIPNTQTQIDFAADRIVDFMLNMTQAQENRAAAAAVVLPTPIDPNS
jgi:hypothetical protein